MRTGRRLKGRLRWSALVVVVILAVLTGRLFVWPPLNHLAKADAILVMSGAGSRDQRGLALAREGYAPLLLVSNGLEHPKGVCGSRYHGVQVVCFVAQPYTTQGEARFLAQTARKDHLHSVIVVSGRAQTVRARIRVDRCFHGRVVMDPVSPSGFAEGAYLVLYEWGALIKALTLQRGC